MKRSLMIALLVLGLPMGAAAYQDTPPQVPLGIAVGPSLNIEVSFSNMSNSQGCSFNGAFVVDPTLDRETKLAILDVLLFAKEHGLPVRVRLDGCTDRPKFYYAFLTPTWI